MPEISVIIPTYNSARFLKNTIQSVLNQSLSDFELLVVDDGSTDDTRRVVSQFEVDPRVKYCYQENQGGAAARNTGIRNSCGASIAFLDADDAWFPDKLQKQYDVLQERPDVEVVHTAFVLQYLGPQNQITSQKPQRRPIFWEQTLYEELLYRMVVTGSASSVMIRRTAMERTGPFDEQLHLSDRDMWQRLAESHQFHYLDELLVIINKHQNNMSNDQGKMSQSCLQYFRKLSLQVPSPYRYHLPRVAIYLFTLFSLSLLRHGHLRAASRTIWQVLSHACRHPGAVFPAVVRLSRTLSVHFVGHKNEEVVN